jgi:hypothetical protein
VSDLSERSTGCQIGRGAVVGFAFGHSLRSIPSRVLLHSRFGRGFRHLASLCFLGVVLSGCSLFGRSESFITYNLPLTVLLRPDPSVEQALLDYRDACGQPASVNVAGPLQAALRKKLGMVFQRVIVPSSTADKPVDGVVDVALGLKQLDVFVPRKSNRSYPATMTLGLDFSYSDADGTVRNSKKLQSQYREDVEATNDSCALTGLDVLAEKAADKVVEGMAIHLGESAKIREAAQGPKNPKTVSAAAVERQPPQPAVLPPPRVEQPDFGTSAASTSSASPIEPLGRREGEPARLSFRTIFRDENRNQVLEQRERFTVDFEIKNEGPGVANDIEIDMTGHPAVMKNLAHPVKVGTIRPGEVKRVLVDGVLGPVKEVEQAELVCLLRAPSVVELPAAKKFLVAIRPDTEDDAEVLSVDVDQLPHVPGSFKQPQAIGIAIGAGQFRDPAMPGLQFAGRDAEMMAKYFKAFMGVPSQRVRLMQDAHVMKDDLVEVFEQWLPRQADPRGTALVYVSGRAVVDAATGAVSLVPFDGSASTPTRLFSLARLQRALARASIQQAVLLLDLSLESTPGADPAGNLVPAWDGIGNGQVGRLMWIIGNNALQDAHAYRPGQHGLFTYYLFKGLRGAADLDKNGTVLAGELCAYVHRQVQDVAKHQYGNAQEPLCLPNAGQPSHLRALPLSKPH